MVIKPIVWMVTLLALSGILGLAASVFATSRTKGVVTSAPDFTSGADNRWRLRFDAQMEACR